MPVRKFTSNGMLLGWRMPSCPHLNFPTVRSPVQRSVQN